MDKKLSTTHAVSFADETTSSHGVMGESRREKLLSQGSTSHGQRRVLSFSVDTGGDDEDEDEDEDEDDELDRLSVKAQSPTKRASMCESGEFPPPPPLDSSILTQDILGTNGDGHPRLDEGGEMIGTGSQSVTTPKRGRLGGRPPALGSSPSRRAMMVESIRRFSVNPASFMAERRKSRSHSLASFKLSYYPQNDPDSYDEGIGICGWILTALSWLLIILMFPLSICFCLKVVQEYERAVIFRLGRLIGGGARGPGIFFVLPCIENYTKVDLRTVSFDVPPQEILTKDSVTVSVDAVVYYRVSNATVSVANVENAHHSTRLLAQTTLRNMLGTKNLSEILSDREAISACMQSLLDDATESWGIKVERVEIKDVRLPVQLQRAMAAEAEAAREARAKVIAAEGEQKASRALKEAAEVLAISPSALQLRYLQTLSSISAEKNSTIIFPLPIDLLRQFMK